VELLILSQQELPGVGTVPRVLALRQEGLSGGQQAQDAQGHDHVPDGVDDVVVLLGLQEGIAHQTGDHEGQSKGQPHGQVPP